MTPCSYTNRGKLQSTITFTTIIFLHLVPQTILITKDNPPFLLAFLVIFNITVFFVYVYLLLAMANKGYVDDGGSEERLINKIAEYKKYCYRCKTHRPERSHHCSKCNRCIKKMDHHCFWINVCVNNDNLGHFVRFLMFACLATLELVVYLGFRIVLQMKSEDFMSHKIFFFANIFIELYAILVCSITGLFVIAQMKYIIKNITYLESEAVKNLIKYGVPPETNPYDRGVWNNIVDVFGPAKKLFLFNGSGEGLYFKKTYDTEMWPPARGSKILKSHGNARVIDMEGL